MMRVTQAPPRVLGRTGAVLMSVNGIVGAGIFALPALLHAEVGAFAPWLFLIFGLLYAAIVLITARLATMFKSSGGPQLYIEAAFGSFAGFQAGWLLILNFASSRAATLYVLVSYLAVLFPGLADPLTRGIALALLVAGLTVLTASGTKSSIGGLGIGTLFKFGPILLFCIVAISSGGVTTEVRLPDFGTIESVALLVFFAFNGVNSATFAAGEFRDPQRDVPITMLASLGIVTLLYMAVQWGFIAAGAPGGDGDTAPLATAGGAVLGPQGTLLLTFAAVFSIAANALTFYIAGGRLLYGMAERGLLPARLAHISPRYGTPVLAIVAFSCLVAVMLASGAFAFLAAVGGLGSQVIALVMTAAFVLLLRRSPDGSGGGLSVLWWPVIAVSIGFAVFTISQAPMRGIALLAALLGLGTMLYAIARAARLRRARTA